MRKASIKKLLVLCLSLIMVASFAFGCGGAKDSDTTDTADKSADTSTEESTDASTTDASTAGGSSEISGKKILFSIAARDQFLTSMETAATEFADASGVKLVVMDSEEDITKQLSHVTTAVSDGYDGLVVNLVNTDNAADIIASAGDLPIAFVNRNPGDANLEADKYVYVGSDENYSGGYQAEYLASYFEEKGITEPKIVLFSGMPGQEAATTRTAAVKAGLEDAGIKATYVFEDTAEWDRAKAQEKFIQFLGTAKEYDAVICNNDEMALGVIEACTMQGVDPAEKPIVGIDATQVGCEAVKAGTLAFTVYQSAAGQGSNSVKVAATLAAGGSVSEIEGVNDEKTIVWIPFEKVDATNVDDYLALYE